jgi:hypothetical protein
MEDLVNRIEELSHMNMSTSDGAIYKPTLKTILYLCFLGCFLVCCAGGSMAMEIRYVFLRVRSRKPTDRSRKAMDVFGRLRTLYGGLPTVYRS